MAKISWTPEQRSAIDDRGRTILVSAAAGSGKTAVLVERLITRVCDEGIDIDKFLVITFTKAAAGELREKIIDALYKRLAESEGNAHLTRQLSLVHAAKISTIHSFCSSLLREHGNLVDVRGDFRVCDEKEEQVMLSSAVDEVMDKCYEGAPQDFLQLVDAVCGDKNDNQLARTIYDLYLQAQTHVSAEKWLSSLKDDYGLADETELLETKWGGQIVGFAHILITVAGIVAENLVAACGIGEIEQITKTQEALEKIRDALENDWESAVCAAKELPSLNFTRGPRIKYADEREKARIALLRATLKKYLGNIGIMLSRSADVHMAELRRDAPLVGELCRVTRLVDERFGEIKRRRGLLTYSDLERLSIKLTVANYDEKTDTVTPTDFARELSGNFEEILLDEFQDSNIVQDVLFRAVSRDEKNLVMVGDVKQSIYRFRLADPTIFLRKYKKFAPIATALPNEPCSVNLSKNFRSRPEVLNSVNSLFKLLMSERLGDIDYTEKEYLYLGTQPQEYENQDNHAELVYLDTSNDGDEKAQYTEGKYIAARINEMVRSGFKITDSKTNITRDVQYGDFVILLRSRKNRAEYYERALREAKIECQNSSADNLLDTIEARCMISLLTIIDNPVQDIPLISVLKSPLFAFTADELCEIRAAKRGEFYYALLKKATDETPTGVKCKSFCNTLVALRDVALGMETDRLLWHIYNKTDALGIFRLMPDGERRVKNLLALYEHAGSFEKNGYRGVYAFLSMLARLAKLSGDEDFYLAAAPEEGERNAVRIMSVHNSKGLEFPVVFYANAAHKINLRDREAPILTHSELGMGIKWRNPDTTEVSESIAHEAIAHKLVSQTKSEEIRLLYVALTRAREKLIVVAGMKQPEILIEQLEALCKTPGAPRPEELLIGESTEAWFVLPIARDGFKTVVVRELDELAAIQPEELHDESVEADIPELSKRFSFSYPYRELTEIPAKFTATGLLDGEQSEKPGTRIFKRPAFVREKSLTPTEKGTALHTAMQLIAIENALSEQAVKKEISTLFEKKFITRAEADSINPQDIAAFYASPLGERVRGAERVSREFKFSVLYPLARLVRTDAPTDEKVLLQGIVDLFFEQDGKINIVDFKTGRAPNEELIEKYKTQLDIYTAALSEILEMPVGQRFLYFINARVSVEV